MTAEDHVIFQPERLSVRCSSCQQWPAAPHVVRDLEGTRFYCAGCCKVCSAVGESNK
jgi:hypothetical protein